MTFVLCIVVALFMGFSSMAKIGVDILRTVIVEGKKLLATAIQGITDMVNKP